MAISVAVLVGDVADRIVPQACAAGPGVCVSATAWMPVWKWALSSRARRWSASRGYIDTGVREGARW